MKKSQQRARLLYRSGITNDELDRLIGEIGAERLMAALDRQTAPRTPIQSVTTRRRSLKRAAPFFEGAGRVGDTERRNEIPEARYA